MILYLLGSTSSISDGSTSNIAIHCRNQKQKNVSSLQERLDLLNKLGLSSEVIDFTMKSWTYQYNHQCDMYYVKKCIKEVSMPVRPERQFSILKLCFDKSHAKELQNIISKKQLLNDQNLEYWMCRYVDCVYNLINKNEKFQNNAIVQNQWFNSEGTSEIGTFEIKCFNIGARDKKSILEKDVTFPLYKSDTKFWYHGTTQESAESIRNEGIKLEEGSDAQDFSHSFGFYLHPEFSEAEKWATCKFGISAGAVLIYKFQLDNFEGLNLFVDNIKWNQIVKYCRNRCPSSMGNNIRRQLCQIDYIIGPMSVDGIRESSRTYVPQIKHGTSQLCIRSEDMAIKVTSALCGIIYFSN